MLNNNQIVQSFFPYNTPNMISKTVVNKLNIQKNEKIYDPACGIGTIFKDIIDHMGDLHYNLNNLYGNDIDSIALDIAKFDIGSQNIKKINSLNNNLDYNNKFDVVISDLPYGLKKNNKSPFIICYGPSGSGKTSTAFYNNFTKVDYTQITETEDNTAGIEEISCAGGACLL
jgi:tRNA G10  N-methylase Trm11